VLNRAFEVRHVLVHEFPETSPYAPAEIDEMIAAVGTFIHAADEGFTQLLYGLYPINQQAMNKAAREESSAAGEELKKLADEVEKKTGESDIVKVQQAWEAFAKAEAERTAKGWTGGTGYPLIYHTALKVLTRDRVKQLRSWLEEEFDETN
jgi:uncharacterized protein YecT (DUF1311 family)